MPSYHQSIFVTIVYASRLVAVIELHLPHLHCYSLWPPLMSSPSHYQCRTTSLPLYSRKSFQRTSSPQKSNLLKDAPDSRGVLDFGLTSMATSKLHVVLFFALIFTLSETHTAVAEVVVSHNCESLRIEVDKLTSKIQSLGYGKPAFESFLQKVNIVSCAIYQKGLEVMAVAGKWAEPHVQTMKIVSRFQSFEYLSGKEQMSTKTVFKSYAGYHWKDLGKSAFVSFMHKVLEKKAQVEKWAEPHVATIKTKWIPAAMEQSMLACQLQQLDDDIQVHSTQTFRVPTTSTLIPKNFQLFTTKVKSAEELR
ncbi:hypothetical protein L2E82_41916 [Cichorium intybus]|uniref:Uncharacterized protein n=1 Tax=Cichorium intybus TaxID=13427 RepID=A0ACB8ZM48_CICIN|nr:hypothetical protein L2E82_41916 [Cichorium intybus]